MRLSRVVLTRQNQQAVLQGMIHIGPDKLYKTLQQDLDWAAGNKYQVFFEGVGKDLPKKSSTSNEDRIRKFFLLIFDLYPVLAGALGVSLQKEKIAYPKNAINADVTLAELTKRLDKNGFRCNFIIWLLTRSSIEQSIRERFAKKGGLNAMLDNSGKWSVSGLIGWFLFRKANPIILDYRNEVAMSAIRTHSNGRNIFIHYGEKHVKGLLKLLQKEEWVVQKTSYTDLREFC